MAYKGKFRASNPSKYKGDASKITYRSRWELVVMQNLDHHPDVLEWSSEEIIIPYRSPIDGKIHRYFPDFIVTKINSHGKKVTAIIEVKPYKQTLPPKNTKGKRLKTFLTEVKTWGTSKSRQTGGRV